MTDLQAIADRIEIDALRAEYADAALMGDYDRFAALFTPDATMRWLHADGDMEFHDRADIRTKIEKLQGNWQFFIQTTHPGVIHLDGDTATGRTYVEEFGRFHEHVMNGGSMLNYAIYHDRYQRTPDGWKFTERIYEIRYIDHTPLPGSAPAHI